MADSSSPVGAQPTPPDGHAGALDPDALEVDDVLFCYSCDALSAVPNAVWEARETPSCPRCQGTFVERRLPQRPRQDTARAVEVQAQPQQRVFVFGGEGGAEGDATGEGRQLEEMVRSVLDRIPVPPGARVQVETSFQAAPANGFSIGDYVVGRTLEDIMAELSVTAPGETRSWRPATEDAIAALPPVSSACADATCAICQCPLSAGPEAVETPDGAPLTALLPCGHAYHRACVVQWLERNGTCPTCRQAL